MSKVRVYLGEVETTRKVKKLVLDGVNDGEWKKSSTRMGSFYLNVGTNAITALGLCDRAINVGTIEKYDSIGKMLIESSGLSKLINLWLFDTNISLADFKSYLAAQYAAGTPVTVWYVLATETTGIVNEPLMKIGDYADTLSKEQAGVNVPTVAGSNTLDVLTPIKPSEVYIKYIGEPVSQMSMLSSRNTDEPEEPSEELSEEAEEIPEEETSEEFSEDKEEKTESITPETTKE